MLGELQDASLNLLLRERPDDALQMLSRSGSTRKTALKLRETVTMGRQDTRRTLSISRNRRRQGFVGPIKADWLHRTEDDLPNLRAALGRADPAARMLVAAWIEPF